MGLLRCLEERWPGDEWQLRETVRSIHKLLDLDLAIIEDAYQSEYMSRLQRAERLATLGQVAGGVAHELRNPLNVVKTSVYYLLNARNPTPQKNADHLKRIERNVELADNVISSLSSFARLPVPELRPIEVEALVREALEINHPKEGIELEIDCPSELPPALGDPDQLRNRGWEPDSQCQRRDAARGPAGGLGVPGRWVHRSFGFGYRRWNRPQRPGSDHGAAVFDQSPGAGIGACHCAIDRGKESGEPACAERAGTRQHLHGSLERVAR